MNTHRIFSNDVMVAECHGDDPEMMQLECMMGGIEEQTAERLVDAHLSNAGTMTGTKDRFGNRLSIQKVWGLANED